MRAIPRINAFYFRGGKNVVKFKKSMLIRPSALSLISSMLFRNHFKIFYSFLPNFRRSRPPFSLCPACDFLNIPDL
ncbi:MAG: hypothetical protein BHW65_02070 [Verrucomicrobia bacterium CAG:312_58_20]|nr:MAG: hypothetical protein BHW65_02070 [Verrucomicrobia bacterium CAG:312_58_20]